MSNDLMDLKDQGRLELTLQTRETIIKGLIKDNKIPESEEDRSLLIKALDGMDRTLLTKAKIKSDDKVAQTQAASAKLIAEMLTKINTRPSLAQRVDPLNIEDIPVVNDLVDGELFIGVQTVKYEDMVRE